MKRTGAIIVLILSFLGGSLYLLAFLIPKRVDNLRAFLAQKAPPPQLAKVDPDLIVPSGLIDYLQTIRQSAGLNSDLMDSENLIQTFEDLQQDYGQNLPKSLLSQNKELAQENLLGISYDASDFEIPQGLENAVAFWTAVFGVYDKNQLIFHNTDHVGLVYSVLDFSDLAATDEAQADAVKTRMIQEERARISQMLKSLAQKIRSRSTKLPNLSREEDRIYRLLQQEKQIDPDTLALAENIGVRTGYAHRFKQAIVTSGQYMPLMEKIFRERGLPTELTCLPFVESSFNQTALSSANAAGIWQFIEATGKNYLHIDAFIDERYDPILATQAAAAHLAREYKLLKSWPLTVNAYNTGPGRMMQAMEQMKTKDIAAIAKNFRGSGYGFDSRNYFPEFLAALEVYRNRDRYFGPLNTAEEESFEYLQLTAATNLKELFEIAGLDEAVMRRLNLAIRPEILDGQKNLPKGYQIKIYPRDKDDMVLALQLLEQENLSQPGMSAPEAFQITQTQAPLIAGESDRIPLNKNAQQTAY